MKKFALLIAVLITTVACDKGSTDAVKRNIADALTNAATPVITTTLECNAVEVIREDVKEAVYKVLKVDEKSLASAMCKSVFQTVMPQLIGAAVNPKWECSATNVQDTIKIMTDAACNKLQ